MHMIRPEPLTREAFAPFGDVIQIDGAKQFEINSGYTTRVHDLIDIQLAGENARAQMSFFLGRPRPLEITMLEKHPLGSQAFIHWMTNGGLWWLLMSLVVTVFGRSGQPDAKGSITIETSGITPYWFWNRNSL